MILHIGAMMGFWLFQRQEKNGWGFDVGKGTETAGSP
jgi:hypothetical protein